MTEILNEGKIRDFSLQKFVIDENNYRAIIRDRIYPGTYIRLMHKDEVMMSNTNMEKDTNAEFVRKAHGKVLIGGLGLGMILLAIQDKPEVESIVVVEKHKEVIDLVGSQLPLNSKVKIINEDVFDYCPKDEFNCIYMDIWNWINQDIYINEMRVLLDKYTERLNFTDENSFCKCWCEKEAKYGLRI